MKMSTLKLSISGMMVAISVVLIWLIHFPVFPAAPFLEYDPADIPVIIGTLMFGPWVGLLITAVTCLVQGLTVSAGSGIIGIVMHFFATGALVLVLGLIYNRKPGRIRLGVAMVCGVLAMTVSMVIWNIIFTPIFMGVPMNAVLEMIVPIIIPFNLIKAGVNSVIAITLFGLLKQAITKK